MVINFGFLGNLGNCWIILFKKTPFFCYSNREYLSTVFSGQLPAGYLLNLLKYIISVGSAVVHGICQIF